MKDLMKIYNQMDENEKGSFLTSLVQECNSWDGSLEGFETYENDEEFFQMFFENKVMEAVRAVSFGNYNYSDSLVRFNGYGNLETLTDWELEQELKGSYIEIIETAQDLYNDNNIDIDWLIRDYEDEEESEEENEE